MRRVLEVGVAVAVLLVVAGGLLLYSSTVSSSQASSQPPPSAPTSQSTGAIVTGTILSNETDTFFTTACSITGIGGFGLRVVSDSTGQPVSGETVSAVDHLGCGSMPQVVYLTDFTSQDGWLSPVFPSQAVPAGSMDFTVVYQGRSYSFTAGVAPIGSNCVTLSVPSGDVTTVNVMNGSGSYCYQETTTSR